MTDTIVLRPKLYNQLLKRFKHVKIAHHGRSIQWSWNTTTYDGKTTTRRHINPDNQDHWGEIYRVRCCYCADTRHRLYISHMWSHEDEETGGLNLWLAYCQNENCLQDYSMKKALLEYVWADELPSSNDTVLKGFVPERSAEIEPPGTIWLFDRLAPDHPATLYLQKRNFDPLWLSKYLGVGYVMAAKVHYHYTQDRLYIPVFREQKLVGWQTRAIGDAADNGLAKYLTMPGMPRSQLLYNYDNAVTQPYVCVMEGVTKVWRYGPEAVATFGKGITGHQAAMLQHGWQKIVILLDPDASRESEALVELLKKQRTVIQVRPQCDPDEMTTQELRQLVETTAAEQGVDLNAVSST